MYEALSHSYTDGGGGAGVHLAVRHSHKKGKVEMLLTMSQHSLLQLSLRLLQLLQLFQSGILTEKKARSNWCLLDGF